MWVIITDVLKVLDHVIFTNYTIKLYDDALFMNNEIFNWSEIGNLRLEQRKVVDGNLLLIYSISARSAGKYGDSRDFKSLEIPIITSDQSDVDEYVHYRNKKNHCSYKAFSPIINKPRKRKMNNRSKGIRFFVLFEALVLVSSVIINIFAYDAIVRFFAFLVAGTVFFVVSFEMVLFGIYCFIRESQTLRDKFLFIGVSFLFTLALVVSGFAIADYYKDIPYALNKNYSEVIGTCTKRYESYGKYSHLEITIDNIDFDVSLGYKNSIKKGKKYRVVYLPNTKEVVEIFG